MSDLVKRLRIKAGMIEMGEMIAWGSDSELMREAADVLEMAEPAEWDGAGLPPVGTVCEVVSPGYPQERFDRFVGKTVTIVAHDQIDGDPVAVFRMPINGDETDQDYHAMTTKCFRPIRTLEQIASEKRERGINVLAAYIKLAKALHNAGRRKTEQDQNND